MGTLKQFGFFALLIAALVPLNAQASIAADIAGGVAADQVIANALADGLTLNEIADQIAQEVGSANIGIFAGALARTLGAATDTDLGDPGLMQSVNSAVGAASAQNHAGRSAGQSYTMTSANFTPADRSVILGTTGVVTLSLVAPPTSTVGGVGGATPGGGAPGGGSTGGGGGGGGGSGLLDAACEAAGSQPGCLD